MTTSGRSGFRSVSQPRISGLFFLNVFALLVLPVQSYAQTVTGRILETWSDRPIEMARIVLMTPDGVEVVAALSDTLGSFRLALTEPGSYLLRADRMGYLPLTDGPLKVKSDQVVEVEVRLSPSPVALDSIAVLVDKRVPFLEANGFYERMREGGGHFIDRSDMEKRPSARNVADLLVGIPGVSVGSYGVSVTGIRSIYGGCTVSIYLDGVRIENTGWEKEIHPSNLEAIEVYRRPSEVPARYGGATSGCGVILIWTRRGIGGTDRIGIIGAARPWGRGERCPSPTD